MTARGRCALLIFFALLLGSVPALAQAPPPADRQILVKEIAVQGNRRVQEAVILARVGAKIGSPFVANRTAATPMLLQEVERRAAQEPTTFVLLIPDVSSRKAADWTLTDGLKSLRRAARSPAGQRPAHV